MPRGIKRNFSGGEVATTISSRDDLAKYQSSCRTVENFIVQLHGGSRFRPGFKYIGECSGYSDITYGCMIPFEFNTEEEDIYVLDFTNYRLHIIQDDGYVESAGVPIEITTAFSSDQTKELTYSQSGDIVYIAHNQLGLYELKRLSHTSWTLTAVTYGTTQAAPTSPAAVWHGSAGVYFNQYYKIAAVNDEGEESLPTSAFYVTGLPSSEWVAGDYITLSWTAAAGAVEYNVYKDSGGIFGFIGVTTATSFWDDNYLGDPSQTPQIDNSPFTSVHPGVVCFHQQRLWLGGAYEEPYKLYGSRTGDFKNFNKSRPLRDDDALEFALYSTKVSQIRWMLSFGKLIIGTAGAEFVVKGTASDTITPISVDSTPQSYWGSNLLKPIVVGSEILHVTRQGASIRDLFYSLEKDGYQGNDLSVLASHLFDGHQIVSWAYQQKPDSVVWAVRDDGVLLGMTYLKEHEIWGWHRHITDGYYEDVCVVGSADEDRLYARIKRNVNGADVRYIERLSNKWKAADGIENAFYIDCGLTYNGWNTSASAYVKLTSAGGWEAGDTLTMISSSGPVFSSGSIGDRYRIKSADGLHKVDLIITAYTSPTEVSVIAFSDVDSSLQDVFLNDYVKLVSIVSGLDHLEGKTVVALIDGSPTTEYTVTSAEVNFGQYFAIAHIGLSYTGVLAPLPFELESEVGTTQGQPRGFGEIKIRLFESVGGKVGAGGIDTDPSTLETNTLLYTPEFWGEPVAPFTGVKPEQGIGGTEEDLAVYIIQDTPLPLNVLSIVADVDYGEI